MRAASGFVRTRSGRHYHVRGPRHRGEEVGLRVDLLDKMLHIGEGRQLKKLQAVARQVNSIEDDYTSMSDEDLRGQTSDLRQRHDNGESLDSLMPEAFATVREASTRVLDKRHFDVQIMGGAALHWCNIAEMKTGEGKTLVGVLTSYLNALTGKGVHIVTVNDYLAQFQSEQMGRIHHFLGMDVGAILAHMDPPSRRAAYAADVTYGTNNEFGFDYLRDNMALSMEDCVQRGHYFAIVDEGISVVEDRLGIDNLYESENTPLISYLNNAIKAKELFKRDKDYAVMDGNVLIVDEHTGRTLDGRRFNEGLHQALEAKEGVQIKEEYQTLATITLQNFFRMYHKLSGMTGTAKTEESEFQKIYGLGVIPIATRPVSRCSSVPRRSRSRRRCPGSWYGQASLTRCSTPSSMPVRRRSSPSRAARALSRWPPTWPAAVRTSSSAATPSSWPMRCCASAAWIQSRTPRSTKRSGPRPSNASTPKSPTSTRRSSTPAVCT